MRRDIARVFEDLRLVRAADRVRGVVRVVVVRLRLQHVRVVVRVLLVPGAGQRHPRFETGVFCNGGRDSDPRPEHQRMGAPAEPADDVLPDGFRVGGNLAGSRDRLWQSHPMPLRLARFLSVCGVVAGARDRAVDPAVIREHRMGINDGGVFLLPPFFHSAGRAAGVRVPAVGHDLDVPPRVVRQVPHPVHDRRLFVAVYGGEPRDTA